MSLQCLPRPADAPPHLPNRAEPAVGDAVDCSDCSRDAKVPRSVAPSSALINRAAEFAERWDAKVPSCFGQC